MQENFKLIFSILWRQVSSLFFLLLLVSALASFFMGEGTDGVIITVILFINTALGFFQEFRASRASEKLLSLIEKKVYVWRGGRLEEINVRDVSVGDTVHLVPGSIVPLDIRVIESKNAFLDDSMRTGESVPKEVKMGDEVFSGASVVSGLLIGTVLTKNTDSSIEKYRKELEAVKKWSSFDLFTSKVIKYVFAISLATLVISLVLLVFVLGKYEMLHFFVFAIAMLVGVVPEMLPLIITIILTRESLALSKDKVIVKRLSALESLGAVSFLLTDKTGTITENKLRVAIVKDQDDFWEYSNSITEGEYERVGLDSVYDEALNNSLAKIKTGTKRIKSFVPFDRNLGYELFTLEGGVRVARGIMKNISALCDQDANWLKTAEEYEAKGMRVIALASSLAGVWKFSGFVAFYDPLKGTALESIKLAHSYGISVKILTGDSRAVARNVAEELHLVKSPESVIDLSAVSVLELSDTTLKRAVVFAKCTPEAKLALIDRFVKMGPVAFLGDGINDSLALRRADAGIAVDNATDIAKESSDIILLEKDIAPILSSVKTGRKALRNILTYIMYTLAGNAGTFISLLVASFFYPVLPMLPIQILLNNLLTDLPLMLIITDNPDRYAMSHVPHLEPKKILKRVLIFGFISSIFDLVYFQLYKDVTVAEFQTGWFILSILAELALILSIRSSRYMFKAPPMSVPLAFGIIVSAIMPFVFVYNTFLSGVFGFAKLSWHTVATLFYLTVLYIAINEIAKYFMRKKNLYNRPVTLAQIFK